MICISLVIHKPFPDGRWRQLLHAYVKLLIKLQDISTQLLEVILCLCADTLWHKSVPACSNCQCGCAEPSCEWVSLHLGASEDGEDDGPGR